MLEQLGKEVLTEYLEKLVQSNVLKLKEEDKQKFNNAERSDKRWVFVDAMKKKHSKVGEMLLQTFFSVDPGSHHGEDLPNKGGQWPYTKGSYHMQYRVQTSLTEVWG